MNVEKYSLLAERTHEKFHQRINLAESKVTLILNNDERTPSILLTLRGIHGIPES